MICSHKNRSSTVITSLQLKLQVGHFPHIKPHSLYCSQEAVGHYLQPIRWGDASRESLLIRCTVPNDNCKFPCATIDVLHITSFTLNHCCEADCIAPATVLGQGALQKGDLDRDTSVLRSQVTWKSWSKRRSRQNMLELIDSSILAVPHLGCPTLQPVYMYFPHALVFPNSPV